MNRQPYQIGRMTRACALAWAFVMIGAAQARADGPKIVDRPEKLSFKDRSYKPPQAANYRRVLSNGTVVFIAEDHQFPLIDLSVIINTGNYLDPLEKIGLSDLAGSQIRAGGTKTISPEAFDEEVEFLAASISSGIGETQGGASAGCLSKDIDRVLELFFDMLRNPAFNQARLDLAKAQALEGMKRRNDATTSIESREWGRLMRGTEHFSTRPSTRDSIGAVTREDLIAFHQQYYHPRGLIIAVSGDFKTEEMLAKLEKHLAGWKSNEQSAPEIPKPEFTPTPGLYAVDKPDVNQGRISIGHLGTMRDNPDRWALMVMNDILGGGGFTSRIMSRVRSDEGLAYSAGSSFGLGVYYDGIFRAAFQSKSPTCAQATRIVLQEIERMRDEKVGEEELKVSKDSLVESFPRQFSNANAIVRTFADDEYTRRDANYWNEYQAGIRGVGAEDVQRVARKYLQPEALVILVVGNVEDLLKGDANRPEYALTKLTATGEVTRIPLPDPMTMIYPDSQPTER